MWAAVLSCALLLLHHTAAELHYTLYCPFLLRANSFGRICVQVVDAADDTPLQVDLEIPNLSSPVSFFDEILPAGDTAKCNDVFIPSMDEAELAYMSTRIGELRERKSVVVNGVRPFCVGEMAKPIYEVGQKVSWRIMCLNATFFPVKETFSVVELLDPAGNRLMQQRNTQPVHYFNTFSYQLNNDAETGYYQVNSEITNGLSTYMSFQVKQYVLPTFEASVTAPPSVSILDDTMTVSVSGKYTYEKNLVAKVHLSVCRKPNSWGSKETCNLSENGICEVVNGYLGPNGTMTATVGLLQFQLARNGLQTRISVEAVITENGTDVQITKTASVRISRQMPTPNFNYQRMPNYYKRGLNATGALTLRNDNDKAMPNETIDLYVKYQMVAKCVTDEDGNCPFTFDTTKYVEDKIEIEARYSKRQECYESTNWNSRYPRSQYTLNRFYSKSGSFVQLEPILGQQSCGQTINIQGAYVLNRDALAPGAKSATFMYMIMGNSEIKKDGQVEVDLDSDGKGFFSIELVVNYEIAPSATIIVSMLMRNGEIVADTQRFSVERCFGHQVNLKFSEEKARPGSDVNLLVKAAPGSSCGIRSIDQSMNILSGGQAQSMGDEVYNSMPHTELWGPYTNGFDLSENDPRCINMPDIIHNGVPYQVKDVSNDGSVAKELENRGMRLISSTDLRKPVVCQKPSKCQESYEHPIAMEAMDDVADAAPRMALRKKSGAKGMPVAMSMSNDAAGSAIGGAVVESLRDTFPEMWMYDETTVNSDGEVQISAKLPGTITKWDTTAFCISDGQGFGVTNGSVYITAFQEFFAEPTLPARIVRGEEFVLKGTAYNYLKECTMIDLTLAESKEYKAELVSAENDRCICENERATHAWSFNAVKLGSININLTAETKTDSKCQGESSGIKYKDTSVRMLVVEPEGIKREETQSAFICSKDGTTSEPIDVKLPKNLVEDSAYGFVTCVGDPLGISLRNLDNLVQMPAGCGEQTLAGFTSNLVAYKYLDSIGSLDTEMKDKILNNLRSGYARIPQFYVRSRCMSTWSRIGNWNRSPVCNLWLTIMAYASLTQAQAIGVYVDERMPTQMESWLSSQQDRTTGAFKSDNLGYNYLVNSNVSFTAYVAISCMKAGRNKTHPVLRDAFFYLDNQKDTSNDTLGQAMSCYAYGLAGEVEKQKIMLDKLKAKAMEDARGVCLKADDEPQYLGIFSSFRRRARSIDILMTSYYLMCQLQLPSLSDADLTYAARMGKWLGGQMNSNGGFSSTMDTAVALDAMASFQRLTYVKNATNIVNLKSGNDEVHQFTVNSENRLLLQRANLPTVPGSYVAQLTGTGCVFCQTTLRYNIKPEHMESSYNLKVWTLPLADNNGDQSSFTTHCNVSYIGKKNSSDMAIMDVTLLSGYRAVESSLAELKSKRICQRYETFTQGHVVLYFDKITKDTLSFTFTVEQTTVVKNLKPATAVCYSYYEKDEMAYAEYAYPSK